MDEYLIYTTAGETIAPNSDVDINNCQILGRSFGRTLSEAIDSLFNENFWISEAGYAKCDCIGVQVMSQSIKDDIIDVAEYLQQDEVKHFTENYHPNSNIFLAIDRLKNISKNK